MTCPLSNCAGQLIALHDDVEETTTGFLVGECGHDHDDNCLSRTAVCSAGHLIKISVRRRCNACTWVGKSTCDVCGGGPKFDTWPALPPCTLEQRSLPFRYLPRRVS